MPRKGSKGKSVPATKAQREFGAGANGPPPKKAGSLPPAHDGTPEGILKAVIADSLGFDVEEISLDTDLLADLGVDSLDIHQLAIDVEEELNVTIPDEFDLDRLKTVRDWLGAVGNPKELRRIVRDEVDGEAIEGELVAEQDEDPGFTAFAQEESEL